MLDALRPRGPDDEGAVLISRDRGECLHLRADNTAGQSAATFTHLRAAADFDHDVALLNTRYAVIDRTSGGHQPFVTGDSSVIVVWNGEIYNYIELRAELAGRGVTFRTASDTEVLAEGWRVWGDGLWNRLNGFWAAALYDATTRSVVLSRDRFGIAPLYVRETPGGLAFASTIGPLLDAAPGPIDVDADIVRGFLDTSMRDFDRRTFYRQVRSVEPATAIRIAVDGYTLESGRVQKYWEYPERSLDEGQLSFDDAVVQLRELLVDSVRLRMRSDLQVAFELSGGLDSSSVVAAAARQMADPRVYTLKVRGSDEEPYARMLARQYGFDYRVLPDVPSSIPDDLDRFADIMEEPYHAPSVYTHFALRRAMKEDGADVVIGGGAGDELFAGYDVDFWPAARRELIRAGHRGSALRCELAIRLQTPARATAAAADVAAFLPRRIAAMLRGGESRRTAWIDPGASGEESTALKLRRSYPDLSFHEQRRYHFRVSRLPYYLLIDDRYSMTLPIEHRVPFLDWRMVEFGLRLPASFVFRDGWTKYILRKAVEPWLPHAVAWRRVKMGFPFSMRSFLRTERPRLVARLGEAHAAGHVSHGPAEYDRLASTAPYRLWRACSVGAWSGVSQARARLSTRP